MKNPAKLTVDQLLFLQNLKGETAKAGRPQGLLRRGYIRCKWGSDPSYGYEITAAGRKALAIAEANATKQEKS